MNAVLLILAALVGLASIICWIIILVEAFKDEVWKGIVGLLCGLYLVYFAVFDFEHDYKWPIVILWAGGGVITTSILALMR